MTNLQSIEDDPKKPNKALLAAVGSGVGYALSSGLVNNPYIEFGAVVVMGAIGAYVGKNPKRYKRNHRLA